jgi:tetratricopeptide (TPR) repeat protein
LGQANVLQAIGDVQAFRDEREAALASYAKAQQLFEQVGAKLGQANVYLALGRLKKDSADFEMAIRLYEQIRDGYSIARGKYYYAIFLTEIGKMEPAKRLLLEARPLWAVIQFDQGVRLIDDQLAELADGD